MNRNTVEFESHSFGERLDTMWRADSQRMFTSRLFWIMLAVSFVMPVLILVMTTMTAGAAISDPNTGAITTMDAFTNTWQIIASPSDAGMMAMDMTAMCNINLIYFLTGVFVCLFVSDDFRSGYAKNLFTVRARKGDYVASKTIAGFLAGALFLLAFFIGAVLGGKIAGLDFTLGAAGVFGLTMCMVAKICLMAVFVAIFLAMSVAAKDKAWMSILLSLFAGMLLFMMIPMMSPLDAGIMNAGMCAAGGVMFAVGLGAVSNIVLKTTDLI